MRLVPARLIRLMWLLGACCLLFPLSAAAGNLFAADLDGDGRRDYVTTDRLEPHLLHVWLSGTDSTQLIRTKRTAQQIIAADLDGDQKPELIWRDSRAHLHVLKNAQGKFHRVRPRHFTPGPHIPTSQQDAVDDDGDPPAATSQESAGVGEALAAFDLWPPFSAAPVRLDVSAVRLRSHRSYLRFVPRPPPALTAL